MDPFVSRQDLVRPGTAARHRSDATTPNGQRRLIDVLARRVVGQDDAIRHVAGGIARRPIASFLFVGAPGVGKTELARAIAAAVFDSENDIIRLDMSQYRDPHRLTSALRRRPNGVLLCEGVDGAHQAVFPTLTELADTGTIADSDGCVIDVHDAVLIMTARRLPRAGTTEVVRFRPLRPTHIERIIDLRLARLCERLARYRVTVAITPAARWLITARSYDPARGAWPLVKYLERDVGVWVGRALISGDMPCELVIDVRDGELLFSYRKS